MAVKIRLMRIGAKKRPFYRVVAVDERRKRTGAYIELLGTYNPLTEPHEIILKKDRIDYWIKNGAQLSHGYLRITKQAPQKPPRKPKKSQVEGAPKEIKEEKTEEAPVETNEQPTTDQEKK
ncbi:MAG: SSU ribosomal protein S16P [Candidatus Daviesbacteria bacterium GW2011_GWB1_41_5]|uniref:Small ribosomal subunit protein bS16 n=1 Tax=Candidatus Daviesbacteria bacterium GW2011_GWB1_41_5 TaxID=1618429 RepID=A0A0G0WKZ5_9BACT|nr:MAG: SSU ribosomal protein S16P [Candidatus Daviesbacteria bacterium GW2011_GWB1_41_5]